MSSYFFIGVAGVGMSAIAQYLVGKGVEVRGSDRQFGEFLAGKCEKPKVMGQLEECGVKCFAQDGSGVVEGLDAVVVSTAIEDSNPDLKRAKELNIPVMHRSEMLAKISKEARTIAVSGTSGKSTVTAMIYHILEYAGLQPSVMTGAGLVNLQAQGKIGNAVSGKGEWLVVEADESDGTLVRYEPEIGLILNVDKDHKEMNELQEIFLKFSHNILSAGHTLIVNDAHPLAKKFSAGREFDFGFESYVGVQGVDFKTAGTHIKFRVRHLAELVNFEVPLPGKHNMENALAATAAALQAGVDLHTCADALSTFPGVFRRHQILGTFNGVTLVDDFAHNPAKIAASIKSAQDFTEGRVLAWFQPHGFGPTRFLRKDLVEFMAKTLRPADIGEDRENDVMFFSEIYYAGGTVTRDISAGDLADDLLIKGCEAVYIENRDECAKKMLEYAQPGDTILLMGARDPSLETFAKQVQKLLEEK
ncbi:UDP-N-acetylmuramate--L-alanine ligase [Fibrobacter sp.]|uniref:UDP-N-acetylmuramate--L-alanine ligase n=1 Tax=Fibrobacter sp. TaxID=35828 RepID=UPI00388F3156